MYVCIADNDKNTPEEEAKKRGVRGKLQDKEVKLHFILL